MEVNPIWAYYYAKKEPEVDIDIIGQRRNKQHKRYFKHQRNTHLLVIASMIGFEIIRTNCSTSRRKNQSIEPPRFKKRPAISDRIF